MVFDIRALTRRGLRETTTQGGGGIPKSLGYSAKFEMVSLGIAMLLLRER